MAEPEDFGARNRPHVLINAFRESAQYVYPSRPQHRMPMRENYAVHANELIGQLNQALGELPTPQNERRLAVPNLKLGKLVELATRVPEEGSRTKAVRVPSALEFPGQDILILRTERQEDRTERALMFVPDDARAFLRDRIVDYGRDPGNARRPDIERFEVIETIHSASVASLFVFDVDFDSTEISWWELWVQDGSVRADRVAELARNEGLDVHPDHLWFPDTTVVFVHSSPAELAAFIERVPGAINEVRRATGTIEPILHQSIAGVTQQDWVDDLASRLVAVPTDLSVICMLDTGVAAEHPLLIPGIRGAWTYQPSWGTDDHAPSGGHGTAMASLILYGDLAPHVNSGVPVVLTHGFESMKVLPPSAFPATKPPSYGVVTQGAVALVEIERPGIRRAFCLATSTEDFPPSRPSTWSGALDQISAGSMPGDATEGLQACDAPKRLVLVATGNVSGGMLIDVLPLQPLEDPAQSWNALTIGGFTCKEQMPAPPPIFESVVPANHRSPFSRGSSSLPYDLTPIKPEVLFEAGNMISDATGFCSSHDAVSLLATGSQTMVEPLVPFWATSAATGVAGNFIGQLQAALPDLWPETYRALAVDSAEWPRPIRSRLIGRGAHWRGGTKRAKQMLLREFGYGVPNLDRAILSARNDMTLIAQAEIQPFTLGADGRSAVFNEMHFYDLPWPHAALEQLENEIVTLKVTLSYFVEPNISGKAATRPETYRSFGLRFAMKKRSETEAAFRARVSSDQEGEPSATGDEADYWLLGSNAMQAGSMHCDLWRGHAVDLAGHDAIAVFPVGGWWKTRPTKKRVTDKGRYSLLLSISASGLAVDLYTEVANLVHAATIRVGS